MKENERKCYKCGCSPAHDRNITLHRFPKPGRTNSVRCELWAKYCFPHESWWSPEFQNNLHSRHLRWHKSRARTRWWARPKSTLSHLASCPTEIVSVMSISTLVFTHVLFVRCSEPLE
ncbi:unnamed protein product [Parnassius mnemosyne]|uniref:THAP-type domain-containing protein n=1 Tax=Parnassius mnemosyne TaxID=213953 RepID=A0AAV1M7U9_9NEOP